jgi:hypothetical protein
MPDRQDMRTILKAALPPPQGAVPRRCSRSVNEAVKRLDREVDALLLAISAPPLHATLQELAERISR